MTGNLTPTRAAAATQATTPARTRSTARPIAIAALAAMSVAITGALMTDLGPWYQSLHRPTWQPPDWLFGPVWTTIFALAAYAGFLAWESRPDLRNWARIAALFAVNGILNIVWSALYFRLHRPDWALAETAALWLSVLALIIALAPHTKRGSLLLVPYLLWVSFAAVLNLAVVRLNFPFQGS